MRLNGKATAANKQNHVKVLLHGRLSELHNLIRNRHLEVKISSYFFLLFSSLYTHVNASNSKLTRSDFVIHVSISCGPMNWLETQLRV